MPAKGRKPSARARSVYYSLVVPGLEDLAAAELTDAGATVLESITRIDKRDGIVLFSSDDLVRILRGGTLEDVYQVVLDVPTPQGRGGAKGLAQLLGRSALERALASHHALRPGKRGRSYRVVARMAGRHTFHRSEIEAAFMRALDRLLSKWVPARDDATLELWVHVIGERTIAGVRLSDDTLAGRRYKRSHLPASLKPTVARALVVLAGLNPGEVLIDPMCGAGTILREATDHLRGLVCAGGDIDEAAISASVANVGKLASLSMWDASRLPLRPSSVDAVVTNPPYGRQHEATAGVAKLYKAAAKEWARVLRPGGRAVVLTAEPESLTDSLPRALRVRSKRRLVLRGLPVTAFVIVRV